MDLILPPRVPSRRLGLLPGSFNPPTRAHVALAMAALDSVDAALLIMPRRFPHKDFTGATLEQRIQMLCRLADLDPRLGVAVSDGGLAIDMVREARQQLDPESLHVICGRDAAERYTTWDYGRPGAIHELLCEFRLMVAARHGHYEPPADLCHAVDLLAMDSMDEHSSTRLREALEAGSSDWRHLAPAEIYDLIERIYVDPQSGAAVESTRRR